ncbi:unnamed protein product, partial [Didymodactylos carnosus]
IFVTIETITGHEISVTGNHFIRVYKDDYLPADKLTVDHSIYVYNDNHTTLYPVQIKSITTSWKKGVYNPFTLSGTILVNNVLASCYAVGKMGKTHYRKHSAFLPLRLWYKISKFIFPNQEPYEDKIQGVHWILDWMVYHHKIINFIHYPILALSLFVCTELAMKIGNFIYMRAAKELNIFSKFQ